MKGPELINMYVGQSEENVRAGQCLFILAFEKPFNIKCIIIFYIQFDKSSKSDVLNVFNLSNLKA